MNKILQDIWIIKDGIPLFTRIYDEKLKSEIFGGFMSAMNIMGDSIDLDRGLSNFEFGSKRFYLLKRNRILFIANGDPRNRPKKMVNELKYVMVQFFKKYPPESLEKWSGDISIFDDFKEIVSGSFEDTLEILKNSLW